MFDITKRTNLSNLWNYYRKGFSPNAETLRAPEATGALAAEFGLQGPISAEAFHSLFSGNVPGTTHSFWPKRPKVICIDTCYSPHKSVSLYGIFDQRVRECVWSALRCEDVERFGQCRAWTSPSKIRNQPPTSPIVAEKSQRLPAAPSEGLLGIKFLHNDSRWSRGTNLHTHMPIVSLVARPDQPGYRCLEPSSIFENKRFLGACADSRLHANLLSIGCPAVASKRGPIIAGFKPEWISLFATGNAAILLEATRLADLVQTLSHRKLLDPKEIADLKKLSGRDYRQLRALAARDIRPTKTATPDSCLSDIEQKTLDEILDFVLRIRLNNPPKPAPAPSSGEIREFLASRDRGGATRRVHIATSLLRRFSGQMDAKEALDYVDDFFSIELRLGTRRFCASTNTRDALLHLASKLGSGPSLPPQNHNVGQAVPWVRDLLVSQKPVITCDLGRHLSTEAAMSAVYQAFRTSGVGPATETLTSENTKLKLLSCDSADIADLEQFTKIGFVGKKVLFIRGSEKKHSNFLPPTFLLSDIRVVGDLALPTVSLSSRAQKLQTLELPGGGQPRIQRSESFGTHMANTLDAALCLASARLLDHIRKGEHAVAVTIGQKSTNTLNNLVNDALEREREPSTARAILFSESQNKPSCELYDVVPIRAISNQNAPGIKKGILCEVSRATEETISITHDGETRRFGYPHKDFFQILQLKPLSVCAGDQLLVNRVGRKAEIPRRESLIRLRAVYPQHVETTDGVILAAGTSGFERGWCVDAAVHAPNQLFKNMLIVVPQKSNSVEIDLMWLNKWAKKCTGTLELFGVEGSFSHEKTILRTPQMGTPGDELGRSDEISPAHP